MYSYASRTMCDSLPAARHDAVTQLDDLGNADYLLGVVSLIRQQHQEEKDVGNDGLGIPAKVPHKKKGSGMASSPLSNTQVKFNTNSMCGLKQ